MNMYTATQGASVLRFEFPREKTVHPSVMG